MHMNACTLRQPPRLLLGSTFGSSSKKKRYLLLEQSLMHFLLLLLPALLPLTGPTQSHPLLVVPISFINLLQSKLSFRSTGKLLDIMNILWPYIPFTVAFMDRLCGLAIRVPGYRSRG
jgi:hypothetical protein